MSLRSLSVAARRAGLLLLATLPLASNSFAYGPNHTFDRADFSFSSHLNEDDAKEVYRIVKGLGVPETYQGSGNYPIFSLFCGEAIFDFSMHPCVWKAKQSSPAVSQMPAKGSDLEKLHGLMIKAGGSFNGDVNPLAATYPAQVSCDAEEPGKPGSCYMEFDVGFRTVATKTDEDKAVVANKMITMLSRLGVTNTAADAQKGESYDVANIACVSMSRVSDAVTCDQVVADGQKQNEEYVSAVDTALTELGATDNKIQHSFFDKISLHCARSAAGAPDASCEITYYGADVRAGKDF